MKPAEKKLLELFRKLPEAQRQSLLDFAEFLAGRTMPEEAAPVPTDPLPIPRPEQESVIAAIKRLRTTYPMINPDKLLNETAGFMTKHVVYGKSAREVIDEMEEVFARKYEEHKGGG
jgi:ribosomal protein S17E